MHLQTNTQRYGVDPAGAFAPAGRPQRPLWLSWAALASDVAATAAGVLVLAYVLLGGR